MKRQGFTLIELLAVIVILAIIALIATPTILGVIEKSRKGSAEQSALGYIDAVEKQIAINQVKGENLISDGTYDVPMEEVTVKGELPTKGWLKIEKGLVTEYSFVIGKYVVTKNEETKKGDTPKTYNVYANGTAIYYNPETNQKCDSSESKSTTGTKTGCMKWYIFNDEGDKSSTVNMILDHNTTALIAYNSTKNNSEMKEVKEALINDTKTWNNSLNARLITADEVAKITDNEENFNSQSSSKDSWYYFDSKSQKQTSWGKGSSKYAWLFDNTLECTMFGCNFEDNNEYIYDGTSKGKIIGYWTASPVFDSKYVAWYIDRVGYIKGDNVFATSYIGLRPVITISKSVIS